tara:strand:- start:684 stop:1958 length:1275 start_codon:yes stop_codon:yes gene_type:complete
MNTLVIAINTKYNLTSVMFLAVFLLPTLVIPITGIQDGFYIPKLVLLYCLALAAIFKISLDYKYEVKENLKLIGLPLSFLIITICSALLSDYQDYVWLGQVAHFEGVITLFAYLVLMYAAQLIQWTEETKEKLVKWLLLGSLIVSVVGLLEFYGLGVMYFDEYRKNWQRISATLGNANWIGSYSCIIIPLAIWYCIKKRSYLSLIIVCLNMALMLAAGTRSAYLGLAIVLVVALFIYSFNIQRLILIICFFLAGILLVVPRLHFIENRLIGTAIELAKYNDPLGGSYRVFIYGESFSLMKKYWLIGCGPDSYENIFPQEKMNALKIAHNDTKKMHLKVTKAHSEFLQIILTTGVFGLLTLTLIFSKAVVTCFKNQNILSRTFGICILAYLLQIAFSNSMIGVAPVFWILIGISLSEKTCHKHQL